MVELVGFLRLIIDIVLFFIFAVVVMSWLIGFGVLSTANPMVASIYRGLAQLTEPILRPIRRVIPALGGLDLSPLVAFLGLIFLRDVVLPQFIF